MEAIIFVIGATVVFVALIFLSHRNREFDDPAAMDDKTILSAIAGQADWLEKQERLSMSNPGAPPPFGELADKRRDYILLLCSTLIARHPEPRNLFYNATKFAAKLEQEGQAHDLAIVNAVREKVFTDNGAFYVAKWTK